MEMEHKDATFSISILGYIMIRIKLLRIPKSNVTNTVVMIYYCRIGK